MAIEMWPWPAVLAAPLAAVAAIAATRHVLAGAALVIRLPPAAQKQPAALSSTATTPGAHTATTTAAHSTTTASSSTTNETSNTTIAAPATTTASSTCTTSAVSSTTDGVASSVREVVACCVALQDYAPTPWHLPDVAGTLSTVVPFLVRSLAARLGLAPRVAFRRQLLRLPDGGTIALDWAYVPGTEDADAVSEKDGAPHAATSPTSAARPVSSSLSSHSLEPRRLLVVQHGLVGSSSSTYIAHLAARALTRKMDVVVMVARGCGGVPLTTPEGFHAARISDFEYALQEIQRQRPRDRLYAAGFSLGAGLLAKYLGTHGQDTPLEAAVCISPPWNLHLTTWAFEWWSTYFLIGGLREYVDNNKDAFQNSSHIDLASVLKAKNVREFDSLVVVPTFGFRDVDDYYTQASPRPLAVNIQIPTLAISAIDDPVCSWEGSNMPEDAMGPGLVIAQTRTGGHVAFSEGILPSVDSWMERVILDWCDAVDSVKGDAAKTQ